MRLLLNILKWLGFALLGLVTWLFGWPWGAVLLDDMSAGKYVTYLEENVDRIDLASAEPGFDFSAEFYENKLILLAEMHGYAAPHALDFALVKHLSEAAGVQYYFAEMDAAQALVVNDYFATGEDTLLREMFDLWAADKAQWGNQEFYGKLGKIRQWNDTRPVEKKVYFVGVDQIQHRPYAEKIASRFEQKEEASRSLVDKVNFNILLAALAEEEAKSRYTDILRNAYAAGEDLPDTAKFYGFWGLFHGMKVSVNGNKTLSMYLQEEGPFAGSVATIISMYAEGSSAMMPTQFLPAPMTGGTNADYTKVPSNMDDTYLFYQRGIKDLKKVAGDAPVTLFYMQGADNPYQDSDRLAKARGFIASMQPFKLDGTSSDASDYVALFQGSPSLTPWSGTMYDVVTQELVE